MRGGRFSTETRGWSVSASSAVVLLVASVGLLLSAGIIRRVAGIHLTDLPPNPYWDPVHAALLYLLLPFVFVSSVVMLLAPGFLIVVGGARQMRFAEAATKGFLVSF